MLATDSKILGERLSELCEVFDRKPISEKALTVWFGLLREFATERVCSALISWPKTHTKFPAPSEVWKIVNDMGIGERERKASEENRTEYFSERTPAAEKFIAQIRQLLKGSRLSPAEHWKRNIDLLPLGHIGHRYAVEALKIKGQIQEREPGCDDELAA